MTALIAPADCTVLSGYMSVDGPAGNQVDQRSSTNPQTHSPSSYMGVPVAADNQVDWHSSTHPQTHSAGESANEDMHSIVYHDNGSSIAEAQQTNSSFSHEQTPGMDNSGNMDVLLDPDLHQNSHHVPPNIFPYSPSMEVSHIQNGYVPSWHIGDDFDIQAFNMSVRLPTVVDQSECDPSIEIEASSTTSTEDIQALWITKSDSFSWKDDMNPSYSVAPTRPITPVAESPARSVVDDRYRDDLSLRMRTRWKEDSLPSTGFLVSTSEASQDVANSTRTLHFTYFLPSSTRSFLYFMDQHFARLITIPCCFYPYVRLVAFLWAQVVPKPKVLSYSKD